MKDMHSRDIQNTPTMDHIPFQLNPLHTPSHYITPITDCH